ncbi:MAG: diacylglycerol/lipid kinase family protein [Halobacteriota archaeon]
MVISANVRPVPVIWNATAGQKKGGPIARPGPDQLKEALAAAGVIARIIPTDSEEDAHSAVEDAIVGGEKLIVGAGGDGTIGAIGKQLLGTDVALGLLPLGSVMNIARMLAVPRELEQAAAVLAARREATIDIGEANGEIFFEAASVGIQAAVFRHTQQFEKGDWGSPFKAVLEAFRYNPVRMELLLDDDLRVATRALMVTISNAPYTGVGMTVAPDARLNDGKFDVRIFRHFSKWELARHLASITFGRRRYSPNVTTHRSANVTVVGKRPLPCRADSHDLGTTPLECHMRPASLKVIVGPDYVDGRAPAEDKS